MKKVFIFIFFSYWIFFFLIPPFQTPDEESHFEFAYWLSYSIYPLVPKGEPKFPHPGELQQNLFAQLVQHDQYIPNFKLIKESNLQKMNDYTNSEKGQLRPLSGQSYNPPIYYFVAGVFLRIARAFQVNLLSQIYYTRLASSLFYFLAIFIAYKFLLVFFKNEKITNSVILLYGLNPLFIQSGIGISPDIAAVFFTSLFLFLILKYKKILQKIKYIILLGIIAGFASLSKITGIILIPGFVMFSYFQLSKNKFLKTSLIFLLTYLLILSPWFVLNIDHYGRPIMTTPAFGLTIINGKQISIIGAFASSMLGFRHIFMHFAGFLGWNDVFPFSIVFIPYTLLFTVLIAIGTLFTWKKGTSFEKMLIVISLCLFLLFLAIDVIRKITVHQGWETGGRDALIIYLPLLIFTIKGMTSILRKKLELITPYLSYFAIWYYYLILVIVLIPRYYV